MVVCEVDAKRAVDLRLVCWIGMAQDVQQATECVHHCVDVVVRSNDPPSRRRRHHRHRPKLGKKKSEKYLLVACTELYTYTHYLLGDRDLDTCKAFIFTDLIDSVIVRNRYQDYDSAALGTLVHQLCCQHLLRDLEGAAEVFPDAHWPA